MENENMCLRLRGGVPLRGSVSVSGGKNAALAILPAVLLCDEPCVIENLPDILDVHVLAEMLRTLGAKAEFENGTMCVDPRGVNSYKAPYSLARKMRASYYLVGVLLGRFGCAEVPAPGGCEIGSRPIDLTIKGLDSLGARLVTEHGMLRASDVKLRGGEVYLDFPSVGATINTMLAAARAEGNTIIVNAAKEPHVVDLANFLNSMGASVKGAGTDMIRIRGAKKLHGSNYAIIPDQIETGTLMIAAAATGGEVDILNAIPTHMDSVSAKLLEMGVHVSEYDDAIRVRAGASFRSTNVKTQVYPGFPTDLQQPMVAMLTTARGISVVTETVFEARYKYVDELRRMGALITNTSDRVAVIEGVERLTGAPVNASDLRAGAALAVAGLVAEGETLISGVKYIDRGYERLEDKLRSLGADVSRVAGLNDNGHSY